MAFNRPEKTLNGHERVHVVIPIVHMLVPGYTKLSSERLEIARCSVLHYTVPGWMRITAPQLLMHGN